MFLREQLVFSLMGKKTSYLITDQAFYIAGVYYCLGFLHVLCLRKCVRGSLGGLGSQRVIFCFIFYVIIFLYGQGHSHIHILILCLRLF